MDEARAHLKIYLSVFEIYFQAIFIDFIGKNELIN